MPLWWNGRHAWLRTKCLGSESSSLSGGTKNNLKIIVVLFGNVIYFAYLCTMIKRCSYGGIGIHKGLKIPRPLGLRVQIPLGVLIASLAQLVEHLFCTQMVEGSSPLGSSTRLVKLDSL